MSSSHCFKHSICCLQSKQTLKLKTFSKKCLLDFVQQSIINRFLTHLMCRLYRLWSCVPGVCKATALGVHGQHAPPTLVCWLFCLLLVYFDSGVWLALLNSLLNGHSVMQVWASVFQILSILWKLVWLHFTSDRKGHYSNNIQ